MNVTKIRKDFPILNRKVNGKPLVYLDNAATSQKPKQVLDVIGKYYVTSNANVHRGIHTLSVEATEMYEQARKKVAGFVSSSAKASEDKGVIVFVRNATEAINLVAYSWGRNNIRKGDEIVLTLMEHHSNFVPWQQLAKVKGAKLKVVGITEDGEVDLEEFKKALTKKTKIVAFCHVSNVLGTINDVNRLSLIVHRKAPQAKILVDGAQAVPHMKVDIPSIGCDFYVFTGHKMLGPTGIGVLWGKRALLEKMEPYQLGGEMISKVTLKQTIWSELPWKFEAGTPNIAGAIGLAAAIDYLNKIGMANVRKHEVELTRYAFKKLSSISDIRILGPKDPEKRCGVIAFVLKTGSNGTLRVIPPHDIASILDSYGIEIRSGYNCVQPLLDSLSVGQIARASFYIYNTKDEVDKFMEGIEKVKKIFKMSTDYSLRSTARTKRAVVGSQ